MRVEHDEGRHLALAGAAAQFAQGFDRAGPRRSERAAFDFRQHQGRHMRDLGGEDELSHADISNSRMDQGVRTA